MICQANHTHTCPGERCRGVQVQNPGFAYNLLWTTNSPSWR